MPQIIDVPGMGQVEFPDGMTDDQIVAAIKGTPKERTVGSDVMEALGNVPSSAMKLASDVAQPFLHPIDTAKGLGNLASGAIDLGARKLESALPDSIRNAITSFGGSAESQPGWEEQRALMPAVGDFYAKRYGGAENTRNTLIQDPVGALGDLASLVGVAGMGLKSSGASKAGNVVSRAGDMVDPFALAGRAITKGAAPASAAIYSKILGTTTGSGDVAIGEALKGTDDFRQAMRSNVDDADIVTMARDSLGSMKDQRRAAYQQSLKSLKSSNQSVDISDIQKTADDWLDKYNVKKTGNDLDFSRSTATGKAAEEIEQVYRIVKDWGSKPGDSTPQMLDVLKRKIGDFYATDRNSRAMTQSLKNAVHEKVANAVPEYRKMTAEYAKSSELLDNIETALSSGDRSKADATLRKMLTSIREDKAFRRDLMKQLGDAGGKDLIASSAGRTMSQPFANRMGPMLTSAAGAGGMFYNPLLASLFAMSSPRLAGEVSYYLGKVGRGSAKAAKSISDSGGFLGAQQAGRLPIYEEE